MVAALLSVAVYDYNAAVLIHLHSMLMIVVGLGLLDLVAVRRLYAAGLVVVQIQADIHAGGLCLVVECKECYTGDYCYLYNEFFHGLCFSMCFVPGFMPRTLSKRTGIEILFEVFNIFSKRKTRYAANPRQIGIWRSDGEPQASGILSPRSG